MLVQASALSYYYYSTCHAVFESTASIVLSGLSAAFMVSMVFGARYTASAINLQSDGETIHLYTHTVFSVQCRQNTSKKPLIVKITEVTSEKGNDGFILHWKNRTFTVHDSGRILYPDLLFAVLRSMPILPGPKN